MLKMVDGTGIIGVDMICPLGGAVSPPQPPNFDKVEMEGVGSLMLPNSLKAPLERVELIGNSTQGENPAPDNPQEIKSAGKWNEEKQKYEVDVKVTGKNLLSNKSADWQIGKGTSWSTYPQDAIIIYSVINSAVNVINLKPSTTYSIVNNSGEIVISRIIERDSSENGIKDHDVRHSKYTFVTNQNTMNAILQFKKVDGAELLSSDIESNKIMLVEGEANEQTPYEPYTEQSVQIALDEPLRGIGEYKDTITKDGVIRKIKHAVFDGSEGWSIDKIVEGNTTQTFVLILKDILSIPNHDKRIMCDKFKFGTALWTKDIVAIGTYSNKLYLNVEKDKTPDLQTFKTWLSQNPLTVDYVLAEPVTEPLPGSVQAQLQALHSENGTTHVFVDSGEVPCGIKLTYRKEK